MGISIVVPMGVFFTQVLLMAVLALIVATVATSALGLLSLAMRRSRARVVPVTRIDHQLFGRNESAWDRNIDSIFAMQTALPSRAPPISSLLRLRACLESPPAGGAGGPVGLMGLAARLTGTRSVHVGKLAFA
jgi:hypothetical protein